MINHSHSLGEFSGEVLIDSPKVSNEHITHSFSSPEIISLLNFEMDRIALKTQVLRFEVQELLKEIKNE